ncbi:MAG: hypothetical protein CVU62_09350 [Deltaproteobacteria bacterium HGW-Deltaproteobacteria-2]|jgi:hypothetical protein|nr:MAG: hypothetical protein CVU62_09350 [Deltaproteobacteria bacterium HGW-Deltaproteobacteria-2]
MKKINAKAGVLFFLMPVLFLNLLTASSYAEQRAIGPKQIQSSAPATGTQAIRPLQQPLMLQGSLPPFVCSSTVGAINDVIKTAQTEVPTAVQAYTNQGFVDFQGTSENTAGIYRNYVQDCCSPNKSFTVQDQQNAGCLNSDNVKLCMEKVIKHCISQYPQKNSLKAMLFNSRDKANKVSAKTKQLHENINRLYDMIP